MPHFPRLSCIVFSSLLLIASFLQSAVTTAAEEELVNVGVAKVDVTPETPVVLAGYGGRTRPFEGIDTRLWARAIVIAGDHPVALVVLDSCGITGEITRRVRELVAKKSSQKLKVSVATTHTHNAPALTGYAPIVWQGRLTPEQQKNSDAYTQLVIQKMAEAILTAERNLEPMKLAWGQGKVTFGGNRRIIREGKWQGFGFQIDAPVDHSLPLLVATDKQGTVRALWANYACHCTTVGSSNRVGGDWAGFANQEMEKRFPSAVSLMSIGCAADVGPQPSGNLDIAREHGLAIAREVQNVVQHQKLKRLNGRLTVSTKRLSLPLEKPEPKSHWEAQAKTRGFPKELAIKLLNDLQVNGQIADSVEYPITTWKFADQLAIVLMPGEVVVDYAVRLKKELDWERLWITGWANRMPGYIPSRKVLMQGGYEADFSQVYYGHPSRYRPEIEDRIVNGIRQSAGESFLATNHATPAPFHSLPSRETVTFESFLQRHAELAKEETQLFAKVAQLVPLTVPAVGKFKAMNSQPTQWYNFKGDTVERWFIRQETPGHKLVWTTPKIQSDAATVLGFTGGLGWVGQPQTAGFELKLADDSIKFDVTRSAASWKSNSGTYKLLYFPIWISNEDSAGFFFIQSNVKFRQGDQIEMEIQSRGQNSLRWVAVDQKQTLESDLKKLKTLLAKVLNPTD